MHLLKKDIPFYWDDAAQCSFDALKHALTTTPLLRPPNYNKDFFIISSYCRVNHWHGFSLGT
jgi:hypothetical protein